MLRTIKLRIDVIPSTEWDKIDINLAQAKFNTVMEHKFDEPADYEFGFSYTTFLENLEKLRRQSE